MIEKVEKCLFCGSDFVKDNPKRKYCSIRCKNNYTYHKNIEYSRKKNKEYYQRKKEHEKTRKCQNCNEVDVFGNAKFCLKCCVEMSFEADTSEERTRFKQILFCRGYDSKSTYEMYKDIQKFGEIRIY